MYAIDLRTEKKKINRKTEAKTRENFCKANDNQLEKKNKK